MGMRWIAAAIVIAGGLIATGNPSETELRHVTQLKSAPAGMARSGNFVTSRGTVSAAAD